MKSLLTSGLILTFTLVSSGRSSTQPTNRAHHTNLEAANTQQLKAPSGKTLHSAAGRFRITLPAELPAFKLTETIQKTSVGDIKLHMYLSEIPGAACMISYSDFPPASFNGRTAQEMLEDGRDGAFKNVHATRDKQENLVVQGNPAISVYGSGSFASGQPFNLHFYFVLVRPRAYQIGCVTSDQAGLGNLKIQTYLNSFRLDD